MKYLTKPEDLIDHPKYYFYDANFDDYGVIDHLNDGFCRITWNKDLSYHFHMHISDILRILSESTKPSFIIFDEDNEKNRLFIQLKYGQN
jgi:hypothetical protein